MSTTVALEPVIGIEIHVQLATRTKMFCRCGLSFGDPPNTHTCPVCLAHPGVLPVVNAEAIRLGIVAALALGCEIAPRSVFHRKNYFYPDLPKAYQISQYDEPLGVGGRFDVLTPDGDLPVGITRVHLEEDAAKLLHVSSGGRRAGAEQSVVDFNRGGTPLAEIVTEPDLRSAADAAEFLRQLRQTMRQLGVSDCNMEEGSMRADANVSVRPVGSDELGTKTELKNMNSFRFLERGIEAEIARQSALVASGERVAQETLHFDPASGELHSLRSKEEAHDYRYFPEPDLVPVVPARDWVREIRDSLGELPGTRRRRWMRDLGIGFEDAEVLSESGRLGDYFEDVAERVDAKSAANWIRGELRSQLKDSGDEPWESAATPERLAELIGLVDEGEISSSAGQEVLGELLASGRPAAEIVDEKGLRQMRDADALGAIVDGILAANPKEAEDLRGGKQKLIGFFVGQVMKETRGSADPKKVQELLRERTGS